MLHALPDNVVCIVGSAPAPCGTAAGDDDGPIVFCSSPLLQSNLFASDRNDQQIGFQMKELFIRWPHYLQIGLEKNPWESNREQP